MQRTFNPHEAGSSPVPSTDSMASRNWVRSSNGQSSRLLSGRLGVRFPSFPRRRNVDEEVGLQRSVTFRDRLKAGQRFLKPFIGVRLPGPELLGSKPQGALPMFIENLAGLESAPRWGRLRLATMKQPCRDRPPMIQGGSSDRACGQAFLFLFVRGRGGGSRLPRLRASASSFSHSPVAKWKGMRLLTALSQVRPLPGELGGTARFPWTRSSGGVRDQPLQSGGADERRRTLAGLTPA